MRKLKEDALRISVEAKQHINIIAFENSHSSIILIIILKN